MHWITFTFLTLFGLTLHTSQAVEVHFESPDSGFFLKHSPRQSVSDVTSSQSSSSSRTSGVKSAQDAILSVDKFTVVQTTQPVSIRASYGPFSTKQTVPARYIVPDISEATTDTASVTVTTTQNATQALLDLQQQSNLHLDISAHLVRQTIPRDSPVLRVLFHAGADPGGHLQRQKICVLLHVSMQSRLPLKGRCIPEGEDGVCVAEVVIPSNWWPSMTPPNKDGQPAPPQKSPQRFVQVSYSVFEPPARNPELCEPKVQIQPLTSFAKVPLVQALATYRELKADDLLTMMVPHQPLYPLSKIHVPVFLQPQPGQNVAVFIVRARVKGGMRILGATASSDEWNVSVEKENPKHTVARVTAFRKDQDPDSTSRQQQDDGGNGNKVAEVFSWLLEVANDTKEHWDGARIVWSVSYVHDGPKAKDLSSAEAIQPHEESRKKLVAKLEIQKDEIQSVLPISKNWELMNTAVLTGRQVSQVMKVFIVTQAGKVADVTLQSSCQAEDESVIKVSSSCSSVYIDGSEMRGSSNASVIVKYATYKGLARFTVWMPEFPLEVSVADFRLSQIKGWKIPEEHNSVNGKTSRRRKRAYNWNHHSEDFVNGVGSERSACRARYQQSSVDVYAKFVAVDQDSGRVSYLISRRTGLRVTDLVQPLLRVADPKIATLRGRTLQGRMMGRTDVQVLSPINGRVIGTKEIRVGSDKVSITKLIVRVISGLQLSITPDSYVENGYIAETSVTRKLTAQYQEGLLDIDIEFSDNSRTPLRDISVDDYFLLVESLDTDVVAFAPMLASHHPRVIAVGEGNGDLLRVTLLLSEECRMRRNIPMGKQSPKTVTGPLASALASVQVDFSTPDASPNNQRPDTVQNDGISGRERKGKDKDPNDLSDILIGIPLRDDHSNEKPAVQARKHGSNGGGGLTPISISSGKSPIRADMSTLEVGMYVLLTGFCLAIGIFVISCVVYASKFRPVTVDMVSEDMGLRKDPINGSSGIAMLRDSRRPRESTTNAHDWVWLGRATMDRSVASHQQPHEIDPRDARMRITSNPLPLNYVDPDDAVLQMNSFDNPNAIELPTKATGINSATYTKRDRRSYHSDDAPPPPPLPPHMSMNGNEYRPPVPPHRNIGVTANINNGVVGGVSQGRQIPEVPRRHKHVRNVSNAQNRRSNGSNILPPQDIQVHYAAAAAGDRSSNPSHSLNFTQQQINAALFNSNSPSYSVQPIASGSSKHYQNQELHMAEILVETANGQQRSAFQFDTITPKKKTAKATPNNNCGATDYNDAPLSSVMLDSGIEISQASVEEDDTKGISSAADPTATVSSSKTTDSAEKSSSESSSDDNGGFVTPNDDEQEPKSQRVKVKRATVVGNPMFSSAVAAAEAVTASAGTEDDGEMGAPGESLGLDDLEMDYDQIMNYFDNLKESNA